MIRAAQALPPARGDATAAAAASATRHHRAVSSPVALALRLLCLLLGVCLRAGLHVALDVLVDRDAGDGVADDVKRQIVELLEVDAGAAHVELLACPLVGGLERSPELGVAVNASEVEGHELPVRAERREQQRTTVVRVRERGEWHDPSEHAPVDSLLIPLRQVLVDGVADG